MTLENKYAAEPHSFYPEGPSASDAVFRSGLIRVGTMIYDPAMGCGSILRMAARNGYHACGDDIRIGRDFLTTGKFWTGDLAVVTNPPYNGTKGNRLEEKFIAHAVDLGATEVWALLPLPWLGARVPWLAQMGCEGVYILSPRLSILPASEMLVGRWPGGGGKDYAWFRFTRTSLGKPIGVHEMSRNVELDTRENWTWWDE